MPNSQITHIDYDNSFIKVCGISDSEAFQIINRILDGYSIKLKQGLGFPRTVDDVLPGKIILAHYDNHYRRSQIIKQISPEKILVRFIDHGGSAQVDVSEVRCISVIDHFNFPTLPDGPLATENLLDGAIKHCAWTPEIILYINRIFQRHHEVRNVSVVNNLSIVKVLIFDSEHGNGVSLSDFLVRGGFAVPISLDRLKLMYHDYSRVTSEHHITPPALNRVGSTQIANPRFPNHSVLSTCNPSQSQLISNQLNSTRLQTTVISEPVTVNQFRVDTLPIGSQHEVIVSAVMDGMQCFTVQVKKMLKNILVPMMSRINDMSHVKYNEPLQTGSVCLTRNRVDDVLCRGVVTKILTDGASIYLVDIGSTVNANFDDIYKMPPEFLVHKVMALRFTLAEANTPSFLTPESQQLFKNIAMKSDDLLMQVTKPECLLKQYCELFVIENGKHVNIKTKILEKKRFLSPAEYQNTPFKKGSISDVIVSFVESPFRFFIQLEVNQPMLQLITKSVEKYCIGNHGKEILYMEDVNDNMAVYAQYSEDKRWYRGLIVGDADPAGNVQVFFVDYGNQETIHFSNLHMMNDEMISEFPKQAIECRLDTNYEFAMRNDVIDYFMDMVDGHTFQMKVLNVLPCHTLLVELIVADGNNVKDLLEEQFELKKSPIVPVQSPDYKAKSQGNWRGHNNNSTNDIDFSAFRKNDVKPNRDFDETDNVRKDDYWGDSRKERTYRKFERNDFNDRNRKAWRNDSEPFSERIKRSPRSDGEQSYDSQRRYKNDESSDWSSKNPHRSNNEYNFHDNRRDVNCDHYKSSDGGNRAYRSERDNSDWSSRNISDKFVKSRDRNGEWPLANNDRDIRPFRKSEKSDAWNNDKRPWENSVKNEDWKSNKNGNDRWYSKGDDWGPRNDNWNDRKEGGFKQRRENSDYKGSWYGSSGGNSKPTLEPAYEKGAQFLEYEYQAGQDFEVSVSWLINPAQFYVIPSQNEEFRELMEKIQEDYPNRQCVDLNDLSPNDCLVARDKENVIYRARFLRGRPGGALVNFVDYGNSEIVKKNEVWLVSQDHCSIPIQAVCCKLHNISTLDENVPWSQIQGVDQYFGRDSYIMTFVECYEESNCRTWSVKLRNDENQDVGELLVAAGLAANVCPLKSENLYDTSLLRDQILSVFAGAVYSSKRFFVHIEPHKIHQLRDDIIKLCENPENLKPFPEDKIVVGAFVLAPSDTEYFRAMILSIDESARAAHIVFIDYGDENDASFDNIKILPDEFAIFNPQIIECSLHGQESVANEDEFIEAISEKDLLVKVVDVIRNKIHIILYDIEGNRLPFPSAVTETIPVINPQPVLKNTDNYYVSHVTSDKVFIQRFADEKYIPELSERLGTFYDQQEVEKVELKVDHFYAAKSAEFEAWFRCKPLDENCRTIYYIDYGNTDRVEDLIAIKPLAVQFCDAPMQALPVSTCVKFTAENLEPFIKSLEKILFETTFRSIGPREWYADLKCVKTGKTLSQFAEELSCGEEIRIDGNQSVPYSAFGNWKVNEERAVRIAFVNTPDNVYLQSCDDEQKIKTLQDNLQESVKNLLPIVGPYDGKMAALNPSDQKWYRVVPLMEKVVFAIDFGFTLNSPVMKKLPKVFLNDDKYLVSASLNIQPKTESWTNDVLSRVKEILTNESNVIAKLQFVKCGMNHVEMKVDGNNVAEMLVNDGVVKWKGHDMTISHANSLTDFYVQYTENEEDIYSLIEKLEDAEKWDSVDPIVGDLVTAQFVDDGMWYRAEVKKIENDAKYVRFVDYGNEADASQFKVLPNELKSVSPYAVKCTLHSLPKNAEELNDIFAEFVKSFPASYTAYILGGEEVIQVTLEFNGEPLENALLAYKASRQPIPSAEIGETVIVKYINSPSSFFVENEIASSEEIENSLANVESTSALTEIAIGDFVAAKFPDDNLWYRAKIIDMTNGTDVLFIDYGNSSCVEELRALPEAVRTMKQLVKHCAFTLPTGFKEWPEIANTRFYELTCDGNTVFKIIVRDNTKDPAIVDLLDNGMNVADELATLCKAELTTTKGEVSKETAVLSHVGSINSIWVQEQTPHLDEMINEMMNANTFEETTTADVGSLVAAPFGDDWYRAKVISNENGFHVLFIDYGNESETDVIKLLPADLANLAPLAKCCRLKNVPNAEWPASVNEKLEQLVTEATQFHVTESSEIDGGNVVCLKFVEDGADLAETLIELKGEGKDEPKQNEEMTAESSTTMRNENSTEESVKSSNCAVDGSEVEEGVDPVLENSPELLEQPEISNESSLSTVLTQKQTGEEVSSPLDSDQTGVSAQSDSLNTSKKEEDSAIVDTPSSESDMKQSGVELTPKASKESNLTDKVSPGDDYDKFGTPMSKYHECLSTSEELDVSIESGKSVDSFSETFNSTENETDETLTKSVCEIVAEFESKTKVENKQAAAASLTEAEPELESVPVISESEDLLNTNDTSPFEENKFKVTQIYNPGSFYVHKLQDKVRLQTLENTLSKIISMESKLEKPEVGEIVVVKVDGACLRGKVIDVDDSSIYTLKCIDYGHNTKSDVVYLLPQKLKDIPPIAHHCALKIPEQLQVWPDNVCQWFENSMLLGIPTLQLKVIEDQRDVKIVELFTETENISEKVIAGCFSSDLAST